LKKPVRMTSHQYVPANLKPDDRMAILALTVELSRIFARDESEKANITAIDAIKTSFDASAAALFYINNKNVFRMCLAGTDFPIALPEARWLACVTAHGGSSGTARFGAWSLPGMDKTVPAWISACLYGSVTGGSFVFLGREDVPWSDQDLASLASLQEALSPIVETRNERKREEQKRAEAEKNLARSERRLRDLFEGSRDMIYTASADDIITGVNTSAATLLGYPSKTDLTGKPFSDFVFNLEDRKLFLAKMAAQGYVDDYEILLTKKDVNISD